MSLLSTEYNDRDKWGWFLVQNKRRTEVDVDEVERVIELALRTPGLSRHEVGLRKLSIFCAEATQRLQEEDPDLLPLLVEMWEHYRSIVIQRYTAITPVELRAADKVVANVFETFVKKVPMQNIAYDPDVQPLVFGGAGGPHAYFTIPPVLNRPFAIINLPHAAFDNVWQWLALPHETGHDFYATVQMPSAEEHDPGLTLEQELTKALGNAMRDAVSSGEITIPDVKCDLSSYGVPYVIEYSGAEFLEKVWTGWTNEAQADLVGLLSCGGAALVSLQQIIGFEADDSWFLQKDKLDDCPEVHPTPYIRNALNIAALRTIDNGNHSELADEIDTRFQALRPEVDHIVWHAGQTPIEVARVPVNEMVKSAEIAARVLLKERLTVLGGKSYEDLTTFTAIDQGKVSDLVVPLIEGNPKFTQLKKSTEIEPRHALAATVFAFEQNREMADTINRTFKHFV
jgi:hypothetical protein